MELHCRVRVVVRKKQNSDRPRYRNNKGCCPFFSIFFLSVESEWSPRVTSRVTYYLSFFWAGGAHRIRLLQRNNSLTVEFHKICCGTQQDEDTIRRRSGLPSSAERSAEKKKRRLSGQEVEITFSLEVLPPDISNKNMALFSIFFMKGRTPFDLQFPRVCWLKSWFPAS